MLGFSHDPSDAVLFLTIFSHPADVVSLLEMYDPFDEVEVYEGYYTSPKVYRIVPTESGKLCSKCSGKGYDEWAGGNCPSDRHDPILVSEIEGKLDQ